MIYCILITFLIITKATFFSFALINTPYNANDLLKYLKYGETGYINQYITLIETVLILGIANRIKEVNYHNNNKSYNEKICLWTILLLTVIIFITITINDKIDNIIDIDNMLFIEDNIYFIAILSLFFSYSTIFITNISNMKSLLPLYITVFLIPFIGIFTYLSILYMTDLELYLQSILSPTIHTIRYYLPCTLIPILSFKFLKIKNTHASLELSCITIFASIILISSICLSHLIYGIDDIRTINTYQTLLILISRLLGISTLISIILAKRKQDIMRMKYILSLILISSICLLPKLAPLMCLSFYILSLIKNSNDNDDRNIIRKQQ